MIDPHLAAYLGRFVTVETDTGAAYIGTLAAGPQPGTVTVRTGLAGRNPVLDVDDIEDVRSVRRDRDDLEFLAAYRAGQANPT